MPPIPSLRSGGELSPTTAYALTYGETNDGSGHNPNFVLDREQKGIHDAQFDPALAAAVGVTHHHDPSTGRPGLRDITIDRPGGPDPQNLRHFHQVTQPQSSHPMYAEAHNAGSFEAITGEAGPSPSDDNVPDEDRLSPASQKALKQTKRAAQNRAAQRAFRERKDKFVKDLQTRAELSDALAARERLIDHRQSLVERREAALEERCKRHNISLPSPTLRESNQEPPSTETMMGDFFSRAGAAVGDDDKRADEDFRSTQLGETSLEELRRSLAEKKERLNALRSMAETVESNVTILEEQIRIAEQDQVSQSKRKRSKADA